MKIRNCPVNLPIPEKKQPQSILISVAVSFNYFFNIQKRGPQCICLTEISVLLC